MDNDIDNVVSQLKEMFSFDSDLIKTIYISLNKDFNQTIDYLLILAKEDEEIIRSFDGIRNANEPISDEDIEIRKKKTF